MTNAPAAPIACTLTPGDFRERLAWIAGARVSFGRRAGSVAGGY